MAQAPKEGAHLGNKRGQLARSFRVQLSKSKLSNFPVPWRSFLICAMGLAIIPSLFNPRRACIEDSAIGRRAKHPAG